jgi:hypothetical protein
MAQVKLLKISSDGVPLEMDTAADDVTLNSFTVQGGGPALSSTGLDMNNTDVVDVQDLGFNDPSTATIGQTAGALIVDDLMFQTKENTLTVGSAVLFPVITDVANSVDAFRLPALAGNPSATPTDGGEGYLVWDSTNDKLFAWNGTSWDDLSSVDSAQAVINVYTADEALSVGDFLYISAADNVSKVDASGSGAASRGMGFAVAAALDAASVGVQSEGVLGGFTGLTAGARYYANPGAAGGITTTVPVGSGNTVIQVGYAKSATALHIHIEQLGRRG